MRTPTPPPVTIITEEEDSPLNEPFPLPLVSEPTYASVLASPPPPRETTQADSPRDEVSVFRCKNIIMIEFCGVKISVNCLSWN